MNKLTRILVILSFMYSCTSCAYHDFRNAKKVSSEIQPPENEQYLIKKEWTGYDNTNSKERPLCIYF